MNQYEAGLVTRLLLKDGTVTSIQGRVEESEAWAVSNIMSLPYMCLFCVNKWTEGGECSVSVDIVHTRSSAAPQQWWWGSRWPSTTKWAWWSEDKREEEAKRAVWRECWKQEADTVRWIMPSCSTGDRDQKIKTWKWEYYVLSTWNKTLKRNLQWGQSVS